MLKGKISKVVKVGDDVFFFRGFLQYTTTNINQAAISTPLDESFFWMDLFFNTLGNEKFRKGT